MASAGLGKLLRPGAILAGAALLGYVALAWPEPTTRVVRLPYGESQPKAPKEVVHVQRTVKASPAEPDTTVAAAEPAATPATSDEESARVLAAVDPDPSWGGPDPVPSALDLDPDYVKVPPEQLGAEPLPGAELTPAPPVAAG